MARPIKRRRVCAMPRQQCFVPSPRKRFYAEHADSVQLTVDEFETIRLIDYEGLLQEECAEWMDVARTTVQAIYFNARLKLAEALVEGLPLIIQGGEYVLWEDDKVLRPLPRRRQAQRQRGHGRQLHRRRE